jgi:hypothetical protein
VAAILVMIGVEAQAKSSGKAALVSRAHELTDLLATGARGDRLDAAALAGLLAGDASLDNPRVVEALRTLAAMVAGASRITSVKVDADGQHATTDLVVAAGGYGAVVTHTLTWGRRLDGAWGFDPIGR